MLTDWRRELCSLGSAARSAHQLAPRAVQELQEAGASLFSFQLEALWGGRGCAEGGWPREQRVVELAARVRRAGMAAGLALVPGTPAEAAAPYVAAGDVDVARPRARAV